MAEAVLWGGQQLSLRRENRKMIILFTDGAPDRVPEVREAIKKVKKYGIELYVVAMGSDPKQLLDSTSVWVDRSLISPISKIDELGAAFIKLLRKVLVYKKAA
jgi:nitric oxide reductase activation protein